MAPSLGEAVAKPDIETSRLVEALEGKRKQLNLEVEEYRVKKDEEYRMFEKHLRSSNLDDNQQKSGSDTSKSLQERGRRQEQGSSHGEAVQENGWAGKWRNGFGDDGVCGPARTSYLSDVPNEQKDPAVGLFLHEHEREEEFRGLFTPTYLPLLENTPQGQRRGSREAILSPKFESEGLSTIGRNTIRGFSSSATLPKPSFNISPPLPPTHPLAASVPHREDLHERRDSSIASLRSSMRDPKAPRSPKRVLFSIDDIIISPSTSLVAERSNKGPPSHTVGLSDMPSTFQKNNSTQNGKYSGYQVMDWTNSPHTKSENYGFNGVALSTIPNGRPSAPAYLNWPLQGSSASPLTGGEEFEHVNGEDELFAFDEDIYVEDLEDEKESGDGELRSDEEDNRERMPESSPHAGSLPIEIRWPGRQASGT